MNPPSNSGATPLPRKVVKFDPRNGFAEDILSGKKAQTIRSKSIEVGTKVALWEMWRGMRKGWYCPECFSFNYTERGCTRHAKTGWTVVARQFYPKHLLNTTIKECVPIEMNFSPANEVGTENETIAALLIRFQHYEDVLKYDLGLPLSNVAADVVKADTPNWTNKQFIDFFRKTYPDIEKGWVTFWIWRWTP